MATFRIDALGRTPARLRTWLDRARKATAGRSAPGRLGLLAVLAGGLAVAGCLAAWSFGPADRVYLASGRAFRADDLNKVERALRAQGVEYQLDDRRVSVPGRSAEAASAAVAKLDLGPRSPEELREGGAASFWEPLRDKEERLRRERAKMIESLIDDLPGVEDSFVTITHERVRGGVRTTTQPKAFVKVQYEGGRPLPFSTVESIVSILTGNEPGLTSKTMTVMDREGHRYLDSGNPALTALSNDRAREEELSRRLFEQLAWIKDVRITVKLLDDVAAPVAPEPAPRRDPATPASGVSVGLNQAMEIAEDAPLPAEAAPAPPVRRRGEVWVQVPHSYYYSVGRTPEGGPPSREANAALMKRTESLVRNTVRLAANDAEGVDWETIVDVLPDETPADPPPIVASASRRTAHEWALAGVAGAAAAAIVALGTWLLGGRQPARRAAPSRGGLRYHRGTPGTPAPTERVLEFVRRNPETAFSVLNRWTTQRGGRS